MQPSGFMNFGSLVLNKRHPFFGKLSVRWTSKRSFVRTPSAFEMWSARLMPRRSVVCTPDGFGNFAS